MFGDPPIGEVITEKGFAKKEEIEKTLKEISRKIDEQPLPRRIERAIILSEMRLAKETETAHLFGKQLVERIIEQARPQFRLLTLRTFSEQADRFYRAIGFQTKPEISNATHHLILTG